VRLPEHRTTKEMKGVGIKVECIDDGASEKRSYYIWTVPINI
jgi:hypothetical protein